MSAIARARSNADLNGHFHACAAYANSSADRDAVAHSDATSVWRGTAPC
jgi:hypothetical protein